MANIADCGVAIAKHDLDKLNEAIKKTGKKDGYEYTYAYDADDKSGNTYHIVEKKTCIEDGANSKWEHTFTINDMTLPKEEYEKKYNNLFVDHTSWKVLEEKETSNGWTVNWKQLNAYSYQSDTNVHEYDDHITIYFGGRWGFPETLANTLDEAGALWQGAEAEDGCEVLCDTLGNEDFGLRIVESEENKDWHFVEDTTSLNSLSPLSR